MACKLDVCSCKNDNKPITEQIKYSNYIAPVSKLYHGEPRKRITKTVTKKPSNVEMQFQKLEKMKTMKKHVRKTKNKMNSFFKRIDYYYNQFIKFRSKYQFLIDIIDLISIGSKKQMQIDILETKELTLGLSFNEKRRLKNLFL